MAVCSACLTHVEVCLLSQVLARLFCSGDDSQGPKEFGKYYRWPNIPAVCADEPANKSRKAKVRQYLSPHPLSIPLPRPYSQSNVGHDG